MRVRLVALARSEFLQEVAYYEDIRKGLGKRFRTVVEAALLRTAESPLSGKPGVAGTLRILVKDFPFAIVYIPFEMEVVVFAIAHLSRRPGYWAGRINTDRP